jgi:tetratricopeptide (TPR) repeat protein
MKKIVLGALLLALASTYAQKDELKTLKKLYDKDQLSADDFSKYKETVLKLEAVATSENDKVAANFYKAMQPLAEMSTLGAQPNPMMIQKIFTPEAFTSMVQVMRKTLDFEANQEKKVFTADINETITSFKPIFTQMAFVFNSSKKYKEASRVFYNTYQLDPNDVSNLENAAITAMQAEEYIDAEKYYREIKTVGFSGTGLKKFASKPEEVAKSIFALSFFNKNDEQAKKDFQEAIKLNPDDTQIQIDHATIYYRNNDIVMYQKLIEGILEKDPNNAQLQYNVGFLLLNDDAKLVEEINANLKNIKKYDELNAKRKAMFLKALPYFERAHQLDVTNEDTKTTLRLCYETIGMKDKAVSVK